MIYRDYCDGPGGLQTADFVGQQNLDSMTSFLSGVSARGGGDQCEDVAGGLKVCYAEQSHDWKPCAL